VDEQPNLAALDKLKTRIQALCAKTIDNGCNRRRALSAAAKVAELLDRYDLSAEPMSKFARRRASGASYETYRKKRIPLDDCIGAVANFCDCGSGARRTRPARPRYVFFVFARISKSRTT